MTSYTNPNPNHTPFPKLTTCVMQSLMNDGDTIRILTFDQMWHIQGGVGHIICKWIRAKHPWCQGNQHNTVHSRIVVDYCPQKQEPHCTWLTVGGNIINYLWEVATPTADISMAKLLFNSPISTPGAKLFGVDIKNFYLNTPLDHFEYMRLPSHPSRDH